MSLSKVLQEINKIRPYINEDITAGPPETYAGREGRRRNARDRYKTLKDEYTTQLRLSATFILVLGSDKGTFQETATKEFKCFSSDPEGFYKDLANRLPEELYANRAPTGNLFEIIARHLEDKANELGIVEYPMLLMKNDYNRPMKSKEDFVNLLKQAVNEQVGSEIIGLHVINSLSEQAIEIDHQDKLTPIVMTTDDESLALDLIGTLGRIGARSFLVVAGEGADKVRSVQGTFTIKEISSKNVKNVLTNISRLCKNR